jgi:hypothetical protein
LVNGGSRVLESDSVPVRETASELLSLSLVVPYRILPVRIVVGAAALKEMLDWLYVVAVRQDERSGTKVKASGRTKETKRESVAWLAD